MVIALLDSNAEDTDKLFKRACLFQKPLKLELSTNEIAINITVVNNKVVRLEIYQKAIKNSLHKAYGKKTICIKLETLNLDNIQDLVNFLKRRKEIESM